MSQRHAEEDYLEVVSPALLTLVLQSVAATSLKDVRETENSAHHFYRC